MILFCFIAPHISFDICLCLSFSLFLFVFTFLWAAFAIGGTEHKFKSWNIRSDRIKVALFKCTWYRMYFIVKTKKNQQITLIHQITSFKYRPIDYASKALKITRTTLVVAFFSVQILNKEYWIMSQVWPSWRYSIISIAIISSDWFKFDGIISSYLYFYLLFVYAFLSLLAILNC